jgi:hypothetical protein
MYYLDFAEYNAKLTVIWWSYLPKILGGAPDRIDPSTFSVL